MNLSVFYTEQLETTKSVIENYINEFFSNLITEHFENNKYIYHIDINNVIDRLVNYVNARIEEDDSVNKINGTIDYFSMSCIYNKIKNDLASKTKLKITENTSEMGKINMTISFEEYFEFFNYAEV